jgi:hypothetical protein
LPRRALGTLITHGSAFGEQARSTTNNPNQNYLTPVGAYIHSASFFGTYDQGADVGVWNETSYGGEWRGISGSAWDDTSRSMLSTDIYAFPDLSDTPDVGFRVEFVPEPSTGVLAVIACGIMWWRRRRLK